MREKMTAISTALLLCLVLSACGILPTEEEFDSAPVVKEFEGNNYNKYTVVRGDMKETVDVSATYQGTTRVETTGEGPGVQIKNICVKKGQKVEVGDVIIHNYLVEQENIIKSSKRQIESLNLQIKHARELKARELKKLQRLGGSAKQKQNVRSQYDSQIQNCESSLRLIKLDLKSAKEEIEMNDVMADIDGTVTKVDTSFNGGFAEADDVLVVIEGKQRNRFRSKTKYVSQFTDGKEYIITVSGQQYKVKAKKGDGDVIYFYPKMELTIEGGMAGNIELVLKEKKNVLSVPASLVYDMGDKKVVYIEDENGVKTTREVTIGERISNMIEITSGLNENEQIITN